MNVVFLLICSLSVLFFAVFLLECSRPLRKSRRTPVVRKSSGTEVADSAMGRRFLVHLEQQMAEFLSAHHSSATLLLIGMALLSVPIAAHGQTAEQTPATVTISAQTMERLQQHLTELEAEVSELKAQMKEMRAAAPPAPASSADGEPRARHG